MNDPARLRLGARLGFLARDGVIYGMAGALNKALALVTFPLLARHFSVEEFGLIDLLNVSVVLLVTLLVFGQDSAVARFFYDDGDTDRRRQIISQSLYFQLGMLFLLMPGMWLLARNFSGLFLSVDDGEVLVYLLLLQAPFFMLVNFSQNILKWTFSRARFLTISIGSTVFTTLALFVGIVFFDIGLVYVFAIYLAARAMSGLLGLWFVRQWLAPPADWRFLRGMMPYAVPYGIIGIASAASPVIERGLVLSLLGEGHLGLFAAGAKVAALIGLPIAAFQIAWGPFSLAIFKEIDAPATYNLVLKVFAVFALSLVFALTIVAVPVIEILASKQYGEAAVVVFALSLGLSVQAIGWITEIGISLAKKSYLKIYGYLVGLVSSTLAIWLLAQILGLVGVAWGVLIGFASKMLTETWLAQRAYPLPWDYRGLLLLLLVALSVDTLHQATYPDLSLADFSIVAALGVLVVPAIGWWLVLDANERVEVGALVRRFVPARAGL